MSATKTPGSSGAAIDHSSDTGAAHRPGVLLVDDQPARLLTYESILSGLEIHCVKALSGEDALKKLLEQDFAAILLDVNMPGMDGFEVARIIREHPRLERTPIIFVTGVNVSELDRLKGYEVGAIDYIAVPVVPEILRSKVAVLAELYERRIALLAVNRELSEARMRQVREHAHSTAQPDQLSGMYEAEAEQRKRAEAELRESRQRLLLANRAAGLGTHDWQIRAGIITWDEQTYELWGLRPGEPVTYEVFLAGVHPEDRADLQRVVDGALDPRGDGQYLATYRVISRMDGRTRWIEAHGQVLFEDGRAHRLVGTVRDVTDQTLADQRKDEFLAMLAHELRNPLAPIASAAEVLSRFMAPDAKGRSCVDVIQRQAVHLSRLLDDLLDVARITQRRVVLRRQVVSLLSCVDQAIETAEPLIREKGQQLTLVRTPAPLSVNIDRVRIAQSIANVLINAAKYTGEGGGIRVRVLADGSDALIEVTDTGMGISPELLPRIFDLFVQSERPLDRAEGGLGIGLAVCRDLVEMHGGTVSAASPGPDKGATFTIRLPLAESQARSGEMLASSAAPSRRILIVDDNRDAADTLAVLLEAEGHETLAVYAAADALEQVTAFAPEVVLLDIGLPGMNGYEVARRMRTRTHSVRLIALSGYGQLEDMQRSSAAGFDAHLVKPVDPEALIKVLAAGS